MYLYRFQIQTFMTVIILLSYSYDVNASELHKNKFSVVELSDKDRIYNDILAAIKRFRIIVKQQPENVEAFVVQHQEITISIEKLKSALNTKTSKSNHSSTITSSMSSASHPQRANEEYSNTPSSNEIAHMQGATNQFLQGPFITESKFKSIEWIPPDGIIEMCNLASEKLQEIENMLSSKNFTSKNLVYLLEELNKLVENYGASHNRESELK